MDEWLTVELADLDGGLCFRSRQDALAWVQAEINAWSWLWTAHSAAGTLGPEQFQRFHTPLRGLTNSLSAEMEVGSQPYREVRRSFGTAFDPPHQYSLPPHRSKKGERIFAVKDSLGVDIGRWALRLEKGTGNFAEAKNADDVAAIIAAATFNETAWGEVGASLRQERGRYRAEITKLESRVRQLEDERSAERRRSAAHVRALTRRLLRSSEARWKKSELVVSGRMSEAISNLARTDDTYKRQMALLAPVLYWKEKAKTHAIWESVYAALCIGYFGGAAWTILLTARNAIGFLKALTGQNLASAYVITGGALLGGTTLLFWLGRVIVKLFLSEHHLRTDCQEKAVMTQAYLSMDTNERFSEADRAIVLASIFRSSPDGIVKDEGPADIAGTAVLAKLLSR